MNQTTKLPLLSSLYNHLGPALHHHEKWIHHIEPAKRAVGEFRCESELAAQQIAFMASQQGYKRTLLIATDVFFSQMMINAFHWTKLPMMVVLPQWEDNKNLHMLAPIVNFLEDERISYSFLKIGITKFFEGEAIKVRSESMKTRSISQILMSLILDQLDPKEGLPVLPFGMPQIQKTNEGWRIVENSCEFGLLRHADQLKKERGPFYGCVPMFLKWSPELVLSILQDPIFRRILTNETHHQSIDDLLMHSILSRYFPLKTNQNWTGFEKFPEHIKKIGNELKVSIKSISQEISYADYLGKITQPPSRAPRKA